MSEQVPTTLFPSNCRRAAITLVAIIPFLAALVLLYSAFNSRTLLAYELTTYLADNQNTILTAIIISTIPIALLVAQLRYPLPTFLTALQPMLIPAMFIAADPTLHLLFRTSLVTLIATPFLALTLFIFPLLDQKTQNQDDPRQRGDELSSITRTS